MRVEVTYNSDSRTPDTFRGAEAVHYNGGESVIIDAGGDEITLEGVDFIHVYEQ